MSDTTNDTSAIDEKKQSNATAPTVMSNKIGNFVISILIIIACILLYFLDGGLILYLCKLAQSNILPTDSNCFPYTDSQPDIKPIYTNIFTESVNPEMSKKLQFRYDLNQESKILDMFREYKAKPSSSFLANYFIAVIESILKFNYLSVSTVMNVVNETLPEVAIIILGPIIGLVLLLTSIFINIFYAMYSWIANISWLFKYNSNANVDSRPDWNDVGGLYWIFRLGLAFVFIMCTALSLLLLIPIYPYFFFSIFLYKGIIDNQKISVFTIILDVIKYYKISIVSIISIFVILLAFSNLGVLPGFFSILTLALIYWGLISFDIFTPIKDSNLTPSVSYKQATRFCSNKGFKSKPKTFFERIEDEFFGGGNITKEIKRISKNNQKK